MNWDDVGSWVKNNGLSLVGALLTGGTSAAVATGISMIQSATGESEPEKAMVALRGNPEAVIKLKELTLLDEDNIRNNLRAIKEIELNDKQKQHEQTQTTIRNGDNAKGLIKWVRPSHATLSLAYAMFYASTAKVVDPVVLGLFLALPFAYGGLRTMDKLGFNPLKR